MFGSSRHASPPQDALDAVLDMREYDVPYHMRFQVDTGVRCGYWYGVRASHGHVSLSWREDLVQRGEPRICAFDIETTKLPLQFPNAEFDQARPSMVIGHCAQMHLFQRQMTVMVTMHAPHICSTGRSMAHDRPLPGQKP